MWRPLLALALAAACLFGLSRAHRAEIRSFDRFALPAFDSYVYVAMAEEPRVFTIAPWGYRILTPWLAHVLPVPAVRAHRLLTPVLLALSGAALFAFWRRLGHPVAPSLVGVAAFALSPPVVQLVRTPFLSDPVALLLQSVFLLALEAGAAVPVLAALLVLGVYAKETFLLFPPAVYLARRRALGPRRAARDALLAGAPAWAAFVLLRLWWTPHLEGVRAPLDLDVARLAWATFVDRWPVTGPGLLLGGLLPLAVLGAFLAEGRPVLLRHGYLLALTLVLPFVAWVNVPATEPVFLFGVNVHRLLVYALPFLVPLALAPLTRATGGLVAAPRPGLASRPLRLAGAAATVVVVVAPLLLLDRYRRAPFAPVRDGPLVVTLQRESLLAARTLQAGQVVEWRLEEGYLPGDHDPRRMGRMRWFLKDGWGDLPHYGQGPALVKAPVATVLVPTFGERDLDLSLDLTGGDAAVSVNGHLLGTCSAREGPCRLRLPRARLFRGDNLLRLTAPEGTSLRGVRLAPS